MVLPDNLRKKPINALGIRALARADMGCASPFELYGFGSNTPYTSRFKEYFFPGDGATGDFMKQVQMDLFYLDLFQDVYSTIHISDNE